MMTDSYIPTFVLFILLMIFVTLDGGNTEELFVYFLLTTIATLLFPDVTLSPYTLVKDIEAAKENGPPSIPGKRKRRKDKKKRCAVEKDPEGETVVLSTVELKINYNKPLGYGSHGTYEGLFQGRLVAVKRLRRDFTTIATHEVSILNQSDDHLNVIRYYYYCQDSTFIYIALHLCPASLANIIEGVRGGESERTQEWKAIAQEFDAMRAMKEMASGLDHLHGLGLVHRNIKPQNILVFSPSSSPRGKYRMLISDFGLCKKLDKDQSSFVPTTDGDIAAGTSGWRAREILCGGNVKLDDLSMGDDTIGSLASTINDTTPSSSGTVTPTPNRLTKSVDIFALGCVFYYTLTDGKHPYGDQIHRDANIMNDDKDLSLCPNEEARDLITRMLHPEPSLRPDIKTCRIHPFFWDPAKCLTFLLDVSDWFEHNKDPMDGLLIRLERDAKDIVGSNWHQRLDQTLIDSLRQTRKYDGSSVRDLMRALRNKKHHYQDLKEDIKLALGPVPEGFLKYFTTRFPRLLIYAYEVIKDTKLDRESTFQTYFELSET